MNGKVPPRMYCIPATAAPVVAVLRRGPIADWDREGHLLVATRGGKLQVWNLHDEGPETLFEEDLSALEPDPTPAPA